MTATQAELNVNTGVTGGTVTASKTVVVDASSKVDVWNVDNLVFNGNLKDRAYYRLPLILLG
jgi:hypothetical protein